MQLFSQGVIETLHSTVFIFSGGKETRAISVDLHGLGMASLNRFSFDLSEKTLSRFSR